MARVIVSLLAQADTVDVVVDLRNAAGHAVAAEYAISFEALYGRLAVHPNSGAPRSGIARRVRIGIVSPYIVIYDYDRAKDVVTILRIVHGRRKITGKLLRGV